MEQRPEQRPPIRRPESRMFPNISDSRILDRESRNQKTESRGQGDLAHWSSHGYLAKEPEASNESGKLYLAFKGTVCVISSDLSFKEEHPRFTTVSL